MMFLLDHVNSRVGSVNVTETMYPEQESMNLFEEAGLNRCVVCPKTLLKLKTNLKWFIQKSYIHRMFFFFISYVF